MKGIQVRVGKIIKHEGQICRVRDMMHITPGKGQAIVQVKMVNIITNSNVETRFRPDEEVEEVRLDERKMQYLYNEGDIYHFMDTETYEQTAINKDALGDSLNYMVPNTVFTIQLYENRPVGVLPPITIDLKVVETEPHMKGATVSGSMKPAVLETGVIIQVPQFVEVGEVIRVKPEENKYLERVKK